MIPMKSGRLPVSKPVVAVKPLKDKKRRIKEKKVEEGGGCRKKVVNIGYAFAKASAGP